MNHGTRNRDPERRISRRDWLKLVKAGLTGAAASALLSRCSLIGTNQEDNLFTTRSGTPTPGSGPVDLDMRLRAAPTEIQLFPGQPTWVWSYQGEVLHGDSQALTPIPDSYLGPVIRVEKGKNVRIRFQNDLPDPTVVHWHGLHVPWEMDGHPIFTVAPGEEYVYEFPVINRAGTYWYHPHPHSITGPQVYRGLAGFFLVYDEEEAQAGLPQAEYDLPLVLQDRTFDTGNQLVYLPNGQMDRMMGSLGDLILVNGVPDASYSFQRKPYRLRLLNGSNSRIYKLAWEDGTPLTVIGTDAGLLETPLTYDYVMLAPGERVEVWVNFSGWIPGSQINLVSLSFSGGDMGGMMRGMGPGGMGRGRGPGANPGQDGLSNGDAFPVFTARVEEGAEDRSQVPSRLSTLQRHSADRSSNANRPRTFTMSMQGMTWTINGRSFEMREVAQEEKIPWDTLETWVYDNQQGGGMGMMGGMMQMPHPMHIHGASFQIIDRQISRSSEADYETVRDGYVDEGWKDTVLVMPGERVRLLIKFDAYTGLYLNHCHNLEHEDMGMMRNVQVGAND